jgi:putative ABC transport system ATP-binding protein
MTALVEVKNVDRLYDQGEIQVNALNNVSLDIEEGGFVALMGPSGSGKTTLLNIIAGIDQQTSGTVTVGGSDLHSMSESERTVWRSRGVGYIFQFYNLIPVLTAYENVELPLLVLPLSRKERDDHVLAALEAVGMLDRIKHFPRQLSGGQEQRVAIARAIVTDAHILVADEPTGNLDAESEADIMKLLVRLNKEFGKTIIMVTHDVAAADYASRIVRLEKGSLTEETNKNDK